MAVRRRQLDEAADWRAALVQLAGRVQEARAVTGGDGTVGCPAQQTGRLAQRCVARLRGRDVTLYREVAIALAAREVPAQRAGQVVGRERRGQDDVARAAVRVEDAPGVVLRFGDVGL